MTWWAVIGTLLFLAWASTNSTDSAVFITGALVLIGLDSLRSPKA